MFVYVYEDMCVWVCKCVCVCAVCICIYVGIHIKLCAGVQMCVHVCMHVWVESAESQPVWFFVEVQTGVCPAIAHLGRNVV